MRSLSVLIYPWTEPDGPSSAEKHKGLSKQTCNCYYEMFHRSKANLLMFDVRLETVIMSLRVSYLFRFQCHLYIKVEVLLKYKLTFI
jgi:hypothetical protein